MGESLVQNYVHITFSTKNRENLIRNPVDKLLYSYLAGICRYMKCNPIIVGGFTDHVHVLCMLSKNVALTALVERLKSRSSRWIKLQGKEYFHFYWQDGYGAFSIHHSQVDVVKEYIRNQHEHHRTKSFQEEYLAFLKQYKIEYNERYLWE